MAPNGETDQYSDDWLRQHDPAAFQRRMDWLHTSGPWANESGVHPAQAEQTDPKALGSGDPFVAWSHADLYHTVQGINPPNVNRVAGRWADIGDGLDESFEGLGRGVGGVVPELWGGVAAQAVLQGIVAYCTDSRQLTDGMRTIATKLDTLSAALADVKAKVPPPVDQGTAEAIAKGKQDIHSIPGMAGAFIPAPLNLKNAAGVEAELKYQAVSVLTGNYMPALHEADNGVPVLQPPLPVGVDSSAGPAGVGGVNGGNGVGGGNGAGAVGAASGAAQRGDTGVTGAGSPRGAQTGSDGSGRSGSGDGGNDGGGASASHSGIGVTGPGLHESGTHAASAGPANFGLGGALGGDGMGAGGSGSDPLAGPSPGTGGGADSQPAGVLPGAARPGASGQSGMPGVGGLNGAKGQADKEHKTADYLRSRERMDAWLRVGMPPVTPGVLGVWDETGADETPEPKPADQTP